MDISRCLFPTERTLRSAARHAAGARVQFTWNVAESNDRRMIRIIFYYWLFLFFFSDVVQSFVSLELLRGGGRKYFPCMDLQISRRTLHSSGLTWNACERSFPFLAVREIYERACTLNSGDCSVIICSELIRILKQVFLK